VAGETVDEPAGDAGCDHGVAGRDRPDAVEQVGRRDVLEQEPAGSGTQRRVDVLVEVERGEHQDPCREPGGDDLPGGLQAVHDRHPHVHQHDIGMQRPGHRHGLRAVAGLADHLDVGLGLQRHAEPEP